MTDHNNRPEQPQEAGEKLEAQEVFEQTTAPATPLAQENQQALTADEENPLRGMSVREWLEWQDREPDAANAAMQDIIRPLAGLTPETLGGISGAIEGLKPLDLGITKGLQAANLATGIITPAEIMRPLTEWNDGITDALAGLKPVMPEGLTAMHGIQETIAEANSWRDSLQSLFTGIGNAIANFEESQTWRAMQEAAKGIAAISEKAAGLAIKTADIAANLSDAVAKPMLELAQWAEDIKAAHENRAAAFEAGDYQTAFNGFGIDDDCLPYLVEEIKAYLKEHGINALTWYDFFHFRWETQSGVDGDQIEGVELETTTPEGEQMNGKEQDTGIILTCFLRAAERKQKEAKPVKKTRRRTNAKTNAIEKGALIDLQGNIVSFSPEKLQSSFTGSCIMSLPGMPSNVNFDEMGKLNMLSVKDGELMPMEKVYTAFLMALARGVELAGIEGTGTNVLDLYLPGLFTSMGIDTRGYSSKREKGADMEKQRLDHLFSIMRPFEPLVGKTPDGNFYRVATFISYDKDSETAKIATPFIFKLFEYANALDKHHSPLNKLLHGNVGNEPNLAAVELANRILSGVLRRGNHLDYETSKKQTEQKTTGRLVTYRVKFTTLIDDCPQLSAELAAIEEHPDYATDETGAAITIIDPKTGQQTIKPYKKRQAINSKLKQTFLAAYRIINEKSDAPTLYRDFEIKTPPPTKSTVDTNFIITHRGRVDK